MLLKQNRKPQFFADTVRNRNRRFPVVLYGQFSKIKGSHMAHRRPSMFVHGKPNSQAVLTAVFLPISSTCAHRFLHAEVAIVPIERHNRIASGPE